MKLRALVLCDDPWHPAADVRRGLTELGDARFDFEFVAENRHWSQAIMRGYPLVIVAKANHLCATDGRPWLTAESESSFQEFVQGGGGLFLIHGGTCYRELAMMRGVTGGAFIRHPNQCSVAFAPQAGHFLAKGVNPFAEKDEHYQMSLDALDASVFLHSRSEHGVQPAGWTRTVGIGRVCVLTPGHNVEVWLNPEYQKLLRHGLGWLANLN